VTTFKIQHMLFGLAVCAGLTVCLGSQAWRLGIGERGVRVGARFNESGRLELTGAWCDSGEAIDIRSVSVSSQTAQRCHVSFCGVDCSEDNRSLPVRGSWAYGEVPPGYVLDGECPTLAVGGTYTARLGGRIGGDIEYRIVGSREVKVLSKSCNWLWNGIM
jgi:hypothetical protein